MAVVLAVLILGMIGWSLAQVYSSGMDAHTRFIESEKALYAAEAGLGWGLHEASANAGWVTDDGDNDCADDADWVNHSFSGGEYSVCCRNTTGSEPVSSKAIIARGYVPSLTGYRALREVKAIASFAGSQVFTGGGRFNWNDTDPIDIDGSIFATAFEGDDPDPDYSSQQGSLDSLVPGDGERTVMDFSMPQIEIEWFNVPLPNGPREKYSAGSEVIDKNTKDLPQKGIWFVEGDVTINTGSGNKLTFTKLSIVCRGNILITGTAALSMKAMPTGSGKSYPLLLTKNGWIDGTNDGLKDIDGLIFSEQGFLKLKNINSGSGSLMSPDIYLSGKATFNSEGKRVDVSRGFSFGLDENAFSWREE